MPRLWGRADGSDRGHGRDITVLHELVALLQDVASHGEARGDSEATTRAFRERAARARNTANALRQLVSICRPIDLAPSEAETTGGTMPAEGAS